MSHLSLSATDLAVPQNAPLDARQTANSAGGFVYTASHAARLERFLILGTENGSYYASPQELTVENARVAMDAIRADGLGVLRTLLAVSEAGRAPKHETGIFVLALCAAYGDAETRRAALAALPRVCRTHRMLFTFLRYVAQHRGWGRGLRRAIAAWYLHDTVERTAYQLTKYRQGTFEGTNGRKRVWNARNAMRLAHPLLETDDAARRALVDWAMGRPDAAAIAAHESLAIVAAFEEAWAGTASAERRLELAGVLTHEMLPDAWKDEPAVWEALLARMPMTAMVRNLATMTRVGLLVPGSDAARLVAERLGDADRIRAARVHPAQFLTALGTYGSGGATGRSGNARYLPVPEIVAALDAAFYLAFPNVVPAGKRTLVAVDCSGSMSSESSASGVTCRDAAAALGLVQLATEPEVRMVGFTAGDASRDRHTSGIEEIPARAGHRIADVAKLMADFPWGSTDCALPMLVAMQRGWAIDTFQVYTDNETWAGTIHPMEALRRYRNSTGIDAKLVVVSLTANPFTIADPNDAGTLDVVGFDTAVPKLIADFSRGAGAPIAAEPPNEDA